MMNEVTKLKTDMEAILKNKLNGNFEIETEHLNKTIEQFKDVAYAQELKGIKKYGKALDPLDNYDWLNMALQEQVDGTKYLTAEMEKRKFVVNKIRKLVDYQPNDESSVEINYWLDILEGVE